MTVPTTSFFAAETTPARFAEITGLRQGHGFTMHLGLPGGLYPAHYAEGELARRFGEAEINYIITPAATINEGRRKAGLGE